MMIDADDDDDENDGGDDDSSVLFEDYNGTNERQFLFWRSSRSPTTQPFWPVNGIGKTK